MFDQDDFDACNESDATLAFGRRAAIPLVIPPLRERSEDIPDLIQHFSAEIKRKTSDRIIGSGDVACSVGLLGYFVRYRWPSNELENVMDRIVVLAREAI